MTLTQIVILAVVQGLAELLPVSSSAHVIAVAKLMHLKPNAPEFTLLLVMLHTGTMFAVIVYFWGAWKKAFFSSREKFARFANRIIIATIVTGILGMGLKLTIEKYLKHSHPGQAGEIEELFGNLELIAVALAGAGLLILLSGLYSGRRGGRDRISLGDAVAIGAIQGLSLPFRGFSRSGSTISMGLLRGIARIKVEEYSFALAVVLTPAVIFLEARRLVHHNATTLGGSHISFHDFAPSLIGMVFSFLAGLVALKVLSRLLEKGQWWIFGVYCLFAAGVVFGMYLQGL